LGAPLVNLCLFYHKDAPDANAFAGNGCKSWKKLPLKCWKMQEKSINIGTKNKKMKKKGCNIASLLI
jgi:hypothetical protein